MEFPKQPESVDESKEAIPVEMYTVSGFKEANTNKYLRSKAQDELIKKSAEDARKDLNILIRESFTKDNPEVWIKAAEMIRLAPEEEQASLMREVFEKGIGEEIIYAKYLD